MKTPSFTEDISLFESGCIQCSNCGWKPDDKWDTAPEGFDFRDDTWYCWHCLENKEIILK